LGVFGIATTCNDGIEVNEVGIAFNGVTCPFAVGAPNWDYCCLNPANGGAGGENLYWRHTVNDLHVK